VTAVDCLMVHPILLVKDVAGAAAFYADKLGFRRSFTWGDPPTTAGVSLGKIEVHLSTGTGVSAVYFVVDDVEELHRAHTAAGVKIHRPLTSQPWGLREYGVQDLDGNHLTFGPHVPPVEPKLAIQRVEVPVRLERRLAAVLEDLAARKGLAIGELLEDLLLHAFEGATTLSRADLAHLDTLKQKHGLDYDTHAPARFVEKP
jgi:uncharacterized glyoxalase superfamily protein PhnB